MQPEQSRAPRPPPPRPRAPARPGPRALLGPAHPAQPAAATSGTGRAGEDEGEEEEQEDGNRRPPAAPAPPPPAEPGARPGSARRGRETGNGKREMGSGSRPHFRACVPGGADRDRARPAPPRGPGAAGAAPACMSAAPGAPLLLGTSRSQGKEVLLQPQCSQDAAARETLRSYWKKISEVKHQHPNESQADRNPAVALWPAKPVVSRGCIGNSVAGRSRG